MSLLDMFRSKPRGERKSFALYQMLPYTLSLSAKWSQYTNAQGIDAYKKSVWLYSCIRLRADNIAAVPWVVEIKRGGQWEVSDSNPVSEIIARPNTDFDWQSMMKMALYWLDLTGDAWFTIVRNGAGRPFQIWPCFPDYMEVMPGRDKLIEYWKYRKGAEVKNLPPQDIIHLRYSSPDSIYYGLSPLQSAAKSVDIDLEASNFQKVELQNHGMPPGVFEGPADLTQEQYEQGVKWVDEQSGPERTRKPWVLGGFKWQPMSMTPHELDFMESRLQTVREMCAAYGVPLPMVGVYESGGGLNSDVIKTARRIFWMESLIPVLREIEGQLNIQLAQQFGSDIRITYDLSNVEALEDDQGAKIERATRLWSMGMPFDRINTFLELGFDTEGVEGADVGYLSSGLLPANFDTQSEEMDQGGEDAAAVTYGDGKPAPVTDEPVANTALNGAQVTALQGIVQAVADGLMPADSALQLILVSFPTVSEAQARAIINPLSGFEQTKPEVTPDGIT